jgi:hypothetical protein
MSILGMIISAIAAAAVLAGIVAYIAINMTKK